MARNVWKKLVLFAAVVCLLFGLTSCGKTETLTLGDKVVVDNHVEFTAENVLVSSKVFPPISGSNPMGWVCDDKKSTYVSVIATVKNLGEEPITINDLWQNFCISMGEELIDGSIIAIVENNGTQLSDGESIEAGKTETVDNKQCKLDVVRDADSRVNADDAHHCHGSADDGNGEAVADGHKVNVLLKAAQTNQQAQSKENSEMTPIPHSLLLSEVDLQVLGKALVTDAGITNQIVTQRPLGEEDDIVLAGLLDLGQVG